MEEKDNQEVDQDEKDNIDNASSVGNRQAAAFAYWLFADLFVVIGIDCDVSEFFYFVLIVIIHAYNVVFTFTLSFVYLFSMEYY